jgi:hypothetical protein
MSIHTMTLKFRPVKHRANEGESGPARIPATPLGIVAGIGLLLMMPGQAKADRGGSSYGHAEISLGFPNAQITVGKTWEDEQRHVIVEEVTHRYPEDDRDRDWDRERDRDDHEVDCDRAEPDHVIIEHRDRPEFRDKVVIIDRYEEPVRCDREVVRRVYVQPRRHHSEVVVYRRPERVIYAPSRHVYAPSHDVYVAPQGHGPSGHVDERGPGRVEQRGSGPRDLFPEDSGRPSRTRGVQHQVAQR